MNLNIYFLGTPYRRADLKNTWSFDCMCPRCKDPTEYGSYVSAMQCDVCKCGYMLPLTPLNHKVKIYVIYFYHFYLHLVIESVNSVELFGGRAENVLINGQQNFA